MRAERVNRTSPASRVEDILINETIEFKQRFFVPTDEKTGVAGLADLLSRYPIMASDILTDAAPIADVEPTELAPPQIVDLDEWFILPAVAEPTGEPEPRIVDQAREIERTEAAFTRPAFYFTRSEPIRDVDEVQLALDFG
ncbi:MAG TPA: hypothetical protein VFB82_18205 [Blastocatellia bacterium]|nr:hypothetical protein [Blastocatellia bacterium]